MKSNRDAKCIDSSLELRILNIYNSNQTLSVLQMNPILSEYLENYSDFKVYNEKMFNHLCLLLQAINDGTCATEFELKFFRLSLENFSKIQSNSKAMLIGTILARKVDPHHIVLWLNEVISKRDGAKAINNIIKLLINTSIEKCELVIGILICVLCSDGNGDITINKAKYFIIRSVIDACDECNETYWIVMWKELWQAITTQSNVLSRKLAICIISHYEDCPTNLITNSLCGSDMSRNENTLIIIRNLMNISVCECDAQIRISALQEAAKIITNQIKHVDDRALFYDELNILILVISKFLSCTSENVSKITQQGCLSLLVSILESNPYEKNYPLNCSTYETKWLLAHQHSNYSQKESRFLELMHESIVPKLLDILHREKLKGGLSNKAMKHVEKILMSQRIACDGFMIISLLDDVSEEVMQLLLSVLKQRCLSLDTLIELANNGIKSYLKIESPYNFEFTILSIAEIKLIPKLCCYFDSMTGHHIYNELTQIFESTISGDTYRDQLLFQGKIDKQIYLMLLVYLMEYNMTYSRSYVRNIITVDLRTEISNMRKQSQNTNELQLTISLQLLYISKYLEMEPLPNTETSAIIELVFPHLLMISRISPFAVNLAVKLPSSISLLYESIGHLQDITFSDVTCTELSVVQYITLVSQVIEAQAQLVRSTFINNSAFPNVSDVDELESDINETKLSVDNTSDYMKTSTNEYIKFMIQENRFSLIVDDENSFFFCFFPFIEHLAFPSDEDFEQQSIICIPHIIRSAAIRCLGQYMICSKSIRSKCLPKLDALVLGETNGNSFNYSIVNAQALSVWMEVFVSNISNAAVLVRGLLFFLSEVLNYSHPKKRKTSVTCSGIELLDIVGLFVQSHYILVKEHKVKEKVDMIVMILLTSVRLSSFNCRKMFQKLFSMCSNMINELLSSNHKLANRIIFRCASPHMPYYGEKSSNVLSIQPDEGEICKILDNEISSVEALSISKIVIDYFKENTKLKNVIESIERSIVLEVLRSECGILSDILQFLWPTPESIKLIQDKMDLNMIQHLSKNAQRNISEHISKKGKFTLTVKEAEEFEIEF